MLFPIQERTLAAPLISERDSPTPWLWFAGILLGLSALALFVDLPVHRFCAAGQIPGELRRLLTWSEIFAHGIGAGILALTMYVLDPAHRRHVPRVLGAALGAGLVADVLKLTIARVRPRYFTGDAAIESFAGWLPAISPVDGFARFDHRLQAFPSAHVAVAAGLAAGLSTVYPRGKYLFAFFAVLAAGQRVESGAHFLSDTCVGAAVGCFVAAAVARKGWLAAAFDRLERTTAQEHVRAY